MQVIDKMITFIVTYNLYIKFHYCNFMYVVKYQAASSQISNAKVQRARA